MLRQKTIKVMTETIIHKHFINVITSGFKKQKFQNMEEITCLIISTKS